MREIKFRGFGTIYKRWEYGFYAMQSMGRGFEPSIIKYNGGRTEPVPVISETVGQYTGLKDKNDVEIYEDDIVKAWSQGVSAIGQVVRRMDGLWIIYPAYQKQTMWGLMPDPDGMTTVEVVGNIYDNPELLEGD